MAHLCAWCHKPAAEQNIRYDRDEGQWVVTTPATVGLYCLGCADERVTRLNGAARD